jgi:Zn-dependent protease
VATDTPELTRRCPRCSRELAPGALACDECHALVHSEELERLSADAKAQEARGELQAARETWLSALRLLPRNSKQAEWIEQHVSALGGARQVGENQWAQGPAQVVPVTRPFNWRSLLSFVAFVGIYWAASGMKFGIGFAVLILIHEMGHFIDIKRRGLPADMPVFLPGLGAYVRWQAMGVPLETRAAVSLAGPLAGFFAALACALLWWQTGDPLWAGLARVGAILNLLNVTPVWVLDGGQAALALSKAERIVLLCSCIVLALVLWQRWFIVVALGAGYQVFFAGNLPARPSRAVMVYFIAVLLALGLIIRWMPGGGLGM